MFPPEVRYAYRRVEDSNSSRRSDSSSRVVVEIVVEVVVVMVVADAVGVVPPFDASVVIGFVRGSLVKYCFLGENVFHAGRNGAKNRHVSVS